MADESNLDTSTTPVDSGNDDMMASILSAAAEIKGETKPDPEAEPETTPTDPEPEPVGDEPETDTPEPTLSAPTHWSKEDRDAFDAATPEVKKWALRRDKETTTDYTKKTQELAAQRKRYEQVDAVLERARQTFNGIPDHEAIEWMAGVHNFLRTEPSRAIQWLRQTYNITDEGTPAHTDESEADPVVSALRRELSEVKAQVSSFKQESQAEKASRVTNLIETFRTETRADGQPAHPHFEAVQSTMSQLIRSGLAKDLGEAYEKAVRLDPTLAAKAQEEKLAAKALAEKKEKAAQLEKARRATFRVGASPSATVQPTNASVEDEMRRLAGGRKLIL